MPAARRQLEDPLRLRVNPLADPSSGHTAIW